MSWHPGEDPRPGDRFACEAIETVIVPRARDLGGFEVRRALPSARRQMVGPFIFWDQMGPAEFVLGEGIDVQPHPHIGLATVTYLFEGEIVHRDSLGTLETIRPGALNLMSAGRGIVHSERTGAEARAGGMSAGGGIVDSERTGAEARTGGARLSGIQAWVALPASHEEGAPAFTHYAADALPVLSGAGIDFRLIAGEALGTRSPVETPMATFFADVSLKAAASVPLDPDYEERAIYIVDGEIEIAGDRFGAGRLLIFRPGDRITVRAVTDARMMFLGGAPMDGPRHIWWNFVSSRKDRIEQAKADWSLGRFDSVPGETDFVPLPGR